MRKLLFLSLLLTFLILVNVVNAITYPKSVDYLKVKFVAKGRIELISNSSSSFKQLNLFIYIPQADERQAVKLLSVKPSTYELVKDEYGNTQVKFVVTEFKNTIPYRIEALVEVRAKNPTGNISFTKETELTKPTTEILQKALEIGDSSLEGLVRLAMWTNSYLRYDKGLEKEVKSAEWIFKQRRGTCDEFSTLFISLTRAWNLPFRYVGGVAYSDRFERHGWVELFVNGTWVAFDPTWNMASYLDATHIKVANLPDANFSEKVELEGKNIEINWVEPTGYELEILESSENPPLTARAKLFTEEIGQGYFLLEGELVAKECLISMPILTSCTLNGKPLFEVVNKRSFWLCDSKKSYWIGKLATKLEKGYVYTCPLILHTEFGVTASEIIKIDPTKRLVGLEIFPKNIITTPNATFNLSITTNLKEFYLLYLNEINKIKDKKFLTLHAPLEGSYGIWVVGLDGYGDFSNLTVVRKKSIKIIKVEVPENLTQGEYVPVNVTIQNLVNKSLEARLTLFFEGRAKEKRILVAPTEIMKESFNISFAETGRKEIRAILDVGEDRDVIFFEVNVVTKKQENFLKFIVGIFGKIIDLFKSFVQGLFKIFF